MTYKDYEIVLERQECEIWSLDDNGDANEYLNECYDSTHQGGASTYQVRNKCGSTVAATDSVEEAKSTIDMFVAQAEVAA